MEALARIPTKRLARAIAMAYADISARMERWLEMVAEYDRRGGALGEGFRGTTEWLAWRCGIDPRTAREHVRVARELGSRPLVRAAFRSGGLSYSQVRAITRVPTEEHDARLLELARTSTAGQLEDTVKAMRAMPSADVDVANRAHARRYVSWWTEPDGAFRFDGRMSADDGAVFVDAIERGAAALHPVAEDPLGPRPPMGARRADALGEIMFSGAPRAQAVLHVDERALGCTARGAVERAGEVCHLEGGPAIPSDTARRLACDADLTVARPAGEGGADLDYGRSRRVVTPALRAALERRDGHCRFPGCDRRHDLHAHHVRHWIHGGPTNRDNLVLLCRFHHRLVHEEGFTVEAVGGRAGFRFRRPDGQVVPQVPTPIRPGTTEGGPWAALASQPDALGARAEVAT